MVDMGKVPRILYVSGGTIDNGGISSYMRSYYKNLDKEVLQIDFLVHGEKSIHDDEILSQGGIIYYAPTKRKNFFENKRITTDILKSGKYRIVHSHMDGMNGLFLREAKKFGIPVRISHSHNTDFLTRNPLKRMLHKFSRSLIGKYATEFWACSQEAGEWLYGDKEFQIIRNAIDIEKFEFRLATRERIREELNLKGKFVVGHIGRLSYQKNQAFLIDTFSEFNKMNPESVLILVGGGYRDNELEKKAKQLSLIGKIIFLGEREDVSEILNCFDVFVFPSRFEGLGIVVIEAQTNGLYCICSTNVPNEVNVTGNVSFYSLENSPSHWAEAISGISSRDLHAKEKVFASKYEITSEAKILQERYLNLIKK